MISLFKPSHPFRDSSTRQGALHWRPPKSVRPLPAGALAAGRGGMVGTAGLSAGLLMVGTTGRGGDAETGAAEAEALMAAAAAVAAISVTVAIAAGGIAFCGAIGSTAPRTPLTGETRTLADETGAAPPEELAHETIHAPMPTSTTPAKRANGSHRTGRFCSALGAGVMPRPRSLSHAFCVRCAPPEP